MFAMRHKVFRLARSRGGAVVPLFALALVPLIAAVGAGVEYGRASASRADLQSAMDAAVLLGASKPLAERVAAAEAAFRAGRRPGDVALGTVTFVTNPDGSFTGTASASKPMLLTVGLGRTELPLRVTATAMGQPNPAAGTCIIVEDPNAPQALLVNSGAGMNAPNCEIHVKSNRDPAMIYNAGADLRVRKLCIKSDTVIWNTSNRPPSELRCNPQNDPHRGKLPNPPNNPPCTHQNRADFPAADQTFGTPGGTTVWCGNNTFNHARIYTFQGLHIVRGGPLVVNAGATIAADGATFYFEDRDARLLMNGNVALTLRAPTTGPYAGIAMFERQGLQPSQFVFNGFNGQSLRGIFYLPSRDVTMNSASSAQADRLQMVVNTLILNSTSWTIEGGVETGGGQTQIVLTR